MRFNLFLGSQVTGCKARTSFSMWQDSSFSVVDSLGRSYNHDQSFIGNLARSEQGKYFKEIHFKFILLDLRYSRLADVLSI